MIKKGTDKTNGEILKKIKTEMMQTHHCHTVILYGARARGEFNEASDYDIIAIKESGEMERDCRIFSSAYLDAFIYPEEYINNYDISLIRIKDGIVLVQKNCMGDELLNNVNKTYQNGPPQTPAWEKQEIAIWLPKMLARSKMGDIEGHFRMHWLLFELLNSYFRLRDLWYLGPKEGFAWLKNNDPEIYRDFESALNPNPINKSLENLIQRILQKYAPATNS